MGKNNHPACATLGPRSAELQFSTALARTAFFLAALSPREFRRSPKAGSYSPRPGIRKRKYVVENNQPEIFKSKISHPATRGQVHKVFVGY